jgi:hypothetical protein
MHALVAARRLRRGACGRRCAPAGGLRTTTGEHGAVKQDESTVYIGELTTAENSYADGFGPSG